MEYNLYFIKPKMYLLLNSEVNNNVKRLKTSQLNKTYLWHLSLAHISQNMIQRLVKEGPLNFLEVENLPQCESCLDGKMTKRFFVFKGNSDVCDLMNINA